MLRTPTSKWLAAAGVAAAALATPAHADPVSFRERPLLRASVQLPGAASKVATTVPLESLDLKKFRILSRPSEQSVVLGYPAHNPCARTKVTLRLKPIDMDPLTYVRASMPLADGEGEETRAVGPDLASGLQRFRAWRTNGDIKDSRKLVLSGVAATTLTKGGRPVIQELRFDGQTTKQQVECATGNRFTIGPGFVNMLRIGR